MAAAKLTTVFLCLCLVQGCSGFFAGLFGPNGIFSGGAFPFASMMGQNTAPADGSLPVCRTKTCVAYKTISKTPNYEHRRYEIMAVAYTSQNTHGYLGNIGLSSRLSGYLRGGKNEDNLVMKMTFPILTPVTNVSTMIFILPVANPPAPTSPKVTVDRLPAMEVYAKPFNGGAGSRERAAADFKASLLAAGVVTTDEAYLADYHTLFSMFNRHTELWVVGKYIIGEEEIQTGPQTGSRPEQQVVAQGPARTGLVQNGPVNTLGV